MPKNSTSLVGKQPETILARQTWTDLLESAFETLDELIRDPIHQLENIRIVDGSSDSQILNWTLYQLGFHIPQELVPHVQKLGKAMHMLSLYHELEGTSDFYKVLSFLFNRSLTVDKLWSKDCEDLYTKPLGPLITDGGDWYLTSHIDLYMQWYPSDQTILDLRNKLLDMFFQFAPINLVIRDFVLQLDLKGQHYIRAAIDIDPIKYLTIGDYDPIVSAVIEGPTSVNQASDHHYTVLIEYQSGVQTRYKFGEWNSDTGLARIDSVGHCRFGTVANDTVITLYCSLFDQDLELQIMVLAVGYSDLIDLIITGPSQIVQGNSGQYECTAIFANGDLEVITPTWIYIGTEGSIDQDGYFTSTVMGETKDIKIGASAYSIRGRHTVERAYNVQLLYIPNTTFPLQLIPVVSPVITAGQTISLNAKILFSDSSEVTVIPYWVSTSTALFVDQPNQEITAADVAGQIQVQLNLSITISGYYLEATHTIWVEPLIVLPVELFIIGPQTIKEKETHRYYASVEWSDGSTSIVVPEWYTNKYYIDEAGYLHAGTTDQNILVNISAKYSANEQEVARDIDITVLKQVISLVHISTIGPDYVVQNQMGQYTAVGTYSDKSILRITPTWTLSTSSLTFASVNSNGQVSVFATPTQTIGTLTATYSVGANTFTYSKQIVFVPILNLVQSISITGPTQVFEYEDIELECHALMSDNTSQEIIPQWEVLSPDPTNYPDIDADIVNIVGILRGRPVPDVSEVIVMATYFKHVALHSVVVMPKPRTPVNTIIGGLIVGPTVVQYKEQVSYAHRITYEDCGDPLLVSSDWSINVLPAIAEIDGNGYFISYSTTSRLITITSTHENCPGEFDTRSITIQVIGIGQSQDQLVIVGPDSITDNSSSQFTAEIHREGGAIEPALAQWSVPAAPVGVNINTSGMLFVSDFNDTFQLAIQAIHNDGINQLVANKLVTVSIVNPVYGPAPIGLDSDQDIIAYLTIPMTSVASGQEFTIELPTVADYGYFCHPSVLGVATFTDVSNGFSGGWDGATWPSDGSIGGTTGPLSVTRTIGQDTQTWYLYRTDFSGLGTRTFRVDYTII
jgi:hypothetical protein